MRHIKKDYIVSRTASSENANFPISLTADMHPKRKYKADGANYMSIITLEVIGGCSDIMLAGTNAQAVDVTVTDPNEIAFADGDDWADGDEWINVPLSVTATTTQRSRTNALWLQLSSSVNVPCEVELVASSEITQALEIGIIRAGLAETYGGRNPKYGLAEDGDDKSIEGENSNGSFYYKKRDVLRIFQASMLLTRENAWRMTDNYDETGKAPAAWRITDKDENEWIIFARHTYRPRIVHSYHNLSEVSVELKEVN